jgi:hypothetical protein
MARQLADYRLSALKTLPPLQKSITYLAKALFQGEIVLNLVITSSFVRTSLSQRT